MDETQRYVDRRRVADLRAAAEHAEHLRRRIQSVAEQVAASEDSVAEVLEESARVRPHAAERLQEAARQAREFAAKEREYVRSSSPRLDDLPDPPVEEDGTPGAPGT
jgi:BioD-like phosphotransacetylase family protein